MTNEFPTFGRFLRAMRLGRGFGTQVAIRAELERHGCIVSDNTYSRWESDEVMPLRPHYHALVRVLGFTPDELGEARRLFADAPVAVRGAA